MLKSMTAFGRASECINGKEITLEIKSVNNRFADYAVRVPRTHAFLEEKIKAYLQMRGISRGKIEVNCTVNVLESAGTDIHLDAAYAESYLRALRELRDRFCLTDDISVMSVAANRDLFVAKKPESDADEDWCDVLLPLEHAADAFCAAREAEGGRIEADLRGKLEQLRTMAKTVEEHAEDATRAYRQRLETKLRQALEEHGVQGKPDEARIVTECALFADKTAVDEELVRLNIHCDALEAAFGATEPVGRKLDFLLQEMNREVNTIGSKVSDVSLTGLVVDMKSELEKIREQIQNIE